jgi:hypothetical protein
LQNLALFRAKNAHFFGENIFKNKTLHPAINFTKLNFGGKVSGHF